jgi:glycosyltransferase involved in cell wall biosynthesis
MTEMTSEQGSGGSNLTLGVVIATVGQRPDLKRMLQSILSQTRHVQAIRIVVDAKDTSLVEGIVADLSGGLAGIDLKVTSTGAERGAGEYLVDTGYGYAVNRGLELLDTDLVAFLDDDDEIRPNHFANLETVLDPKAGRGVAYTRVEIVSPDGDRKLFPQGPMPSGKIRPGVLIDRHPVLLPATLIHRSVLDVVESLDQSLDRLADTDMVVRLGLATEFAPADDPTYVYYRISRKTVVNERVLAETAQMLKKHQVHMGTKERFMFWDTQARQALRAGFSEIGGDSSREAVAVFWKNPPSFLVGLYTAFRGRRTPEFVRRIGRRLGPKSGRSG